MTPEEQLKEMFEQKKAFRKGVIEGLWKANNEIIKKLTELQGKMIKDYPEDYGVIN